MNEECAWCGGLNGSAVVPMICEGCKQGRWACAECAAKERDLNCNCDQPLRIRLAAQVLVSEE